jgi:hypothetical protein
LALEGVEMCVAEHVELEVKVLANEKSSNITGFAGLCEHGGGYGVDEVCGRAL